MKRGYNTTALRMREQRDDWRKRAMRPERDLHAAARCVMALLKTRKDAERWLRLFDAANEKAKRL